MPGAVILSGVWKSFGSKQAVADLDLVVARGAITGFIGPNGAGKTTTIRMLLGILKPDRGAVVVLGERDPGRAKDRLGYLPEERGVYRRMRVGAFLRYIGSLKGAPRHDLDASIRGWLDRVGLGDCLSKRCEELSKGMQQKVQFIAAVLHDPDLLILDEPFSGLDPVNARLLEQLVLERKRLGKTILFSTHAMQKAEQLCDHVVMIDRGRKVLDASIEGALGSFDHQTIAVERQGGGGAGELLAVPGVMRVTPGERGLVVHLADGADPAVVIRAIAAAVPVRRVELVRPTLEDVFVRLAGGPAAIDEGAA